MLLIAICEIIANGLLIFLARENYYYAIARGSSCAPPLIKCIFLYTPLFMMNQNWCIKLVS